MTWFLAFRTAVGWVVGAAVAPTLAASRTQVLTLLVLFAVHLVILAVARPFIVPARQGAC